ncbi:MULTISPECIES: trypsin-like serine protease [unclassified Bradyrhizobium]|uniref:trypsin-like serine protease n=1 Tax=unclassified Bradyrhizobium TaxID=2631580 RepID=UPI0033907975
MSFWNSLLELPFRDLLCSLQALRVPQQSAPINSVPVDSLPPNDPIRHAARPVGLLRSVLPDGTAQICTAIIISDRHILTAAHCAFGAESLTVVFGLTEQERKSFRVQSSPSEIDKERGYAVVGVEGTPSQTFGTARLLLRIPLKGGGIGVEA